MDSNPNFQNTFDRVVVVNLARRPERMERFNQCLVDWPFKLPQRFEAVDGSVGELPARWKHGPGAWGCLLSHRAILESAMMDKVASLLVLEDDALPVPHFPRLAADFFARVPSDWDCLMLGGEHLTAPTPIPGNPGIVRCVHTNRTHAFAIRGLMMAVFYSLLNHLKSDHCDIVLASLMPKFKVYAPDPFLIGQDAGFSDVTSRDEPARFIAGPQGEASGQPAGSFKLSVA